MLKKLRIPSLAILAMVVICLGAQAASTLKTTNVKFNVSGGFTGAPQFGSLSYDLNQAWSFQFTDGSAANKANKIYCLHAATTSNVDLDSTLTLCDGTTGSFSRIAGVFIKPGTSNAAALTLGGDWILTKYLIAGGDTLANVTIPINKTGMWAFVAPDATGIPVTATTGDNLIVTVTGSDSFDLLVLGS